MGTPPHRRSILLSLCAALLLLTCRAVAGAAASAAVLVGTTECSDCAEKGIKNENAFRRLRVAIECKGIDEKYYDTKPTGELDRQGNFAVELPSEVLTDHGELKRECYAQLHGAPDAPCSDPSEIILKSEEKGKRTFIVAAASGKLSFSSATCVSATFWPPYKKDGPLHKFPKYPLPPFKLPHRPFFSSHPVYSPPSSGGSYHKPPPTPVYKKPAPACKPPSPGGCNTPPSSGGHYKPPAPATKPPSGGYYKPPTPATKPPSGGYYKPPTPAYKPTPEPYYKHPYPPFTFKKPWPPIPQLPPFYHPPRPKFYLPPIYKKPPVSQFPSWPPYTQWHKYFHKRGKPVFPPENFHPGEP